MPGWSWTAKQILEVKPDLFSQLTYQQHMSIQAEVARRQRALVPAVMEALLAGSGWDILRAGKVIHVISHRGRRVLAYNDALGVSTALGRELDSFRARGWRVEKFSELVKQ